MERAENMARILGVTSNLVLFGTPDLQRAEPARAAHRSPAPREAFFARHDELSLRGADRVHGARPREPVARIYCCLDWARENAHAVRWQITSEMWETLNATWLEMRALDRASGVTGAGATRFFDWVKERSHLFRGVTYGTIMRGEAFNFSRLGTFLERADNTARILDVKYHILLPSVDDVGGALDYYQWTALLRSVSSLRDLPPALPRPDLADQGGAAPDPRAAHAALARRLLRPGQGGARPHRTARTTSRPSASPTSCTRASRTPTSRRSSRAGCTST